MPASHIVLYASDHGFGHATRMLRLAQVLAQHGHATTLCAGSALSVLAPRSQRGDAMPRLIEARLDPGLATRPGTAQVDPIASFDRLRAWLRALPDLVDEEVQRQQALRPHLVIADAPAAALLAAARLGIPSLLCSNFNWLDVYGDNSSSEAVEVLTRAYGSVRLGLRLSPGAMGLRGVPQARVRDVAGVLARPPERSRAKVRQELGISGDAEVICLGLGGSLDARLTASLCGALSAEEEIRFLAPGTGACGHGAIVPFPSDTPDAQDYLGAADAVLCKAGYSTIAEAALAGVPVLTFPVAGNPESFALCKGVEALGLGAHLPIADEGDVRTLMRSPRDILSRARSGFRGPQRDAAPRIVEILVQEDLLSDQSAISSCSSA